jgi:cell division septum initiation protein DivIVA
VTYADAAHNAALMTTLERAQQARIEELELRLAKMEKMYDKVAADLIDALDAASAYRATASTMHQEIERRNGAERRTYFNLQQAMDRRVQENERDHGRSGEDRRKSWPR